MIKRIYTMIIMTHKMNNYKMKVFTSMPGWGQCETKTVHKHKTIKLLKLFKKISNYCMFAYIHLIKPLHHRHKTTLQFQWTKTCKKTLAYIHIKGKWQETTERKHVSNNINTKAHTKATLASRAIPLLYIIFERRYRNTGFTTII